MFLTLILFESRGLEASERRRKREGRDIWRAWLRVGGTGRNGDLGSGLSAETKGIPLPSPFLTHGSTFQPLSFAFRRTLQATMFRLCSAGLFRRRGERGHARECGGARMKGLYFHINDFMTASFYP